MEQMDIKKVLAFCWYKDVTKELLEEELKRIENKEWDIYNVYHYINTLIHAFPILDKLPFGVQFDIIEYYNSWGKSHQWFAKKRKWVKRVDFNEYYEVLDFVSKENDRLHNFLVIYVWLYLLG